MLKHILKSFYYNSRRDKSTFLVSLIGLSTGLASAILIYLWTWDEISYDNIYPDGDRIHQVMLNKHRSGEISTTESLPYPLPEQLKIAFPEVELSGLFLGFEQGDEIKLSANDKVMFIRAGFSSEDYFEIFSYDIYEREDDLVLPTRTSVAISEGLAQRLFDTTTDVVGKTLQLDDTQTLHVSAVYKDFPGNTTQKYDILMNFDFFDYYAAIEKNWSNILYNGFVMLEKGTDASVFNEKITDFIKQYDEQSSYSLFIRAQADRYLYNKYEDGKLAGGKVEYVRLFALIAMFTLIIAAINFTNLSTARASNRLKEIGVKKALGCERGMLFTQYIGESLIMTIISVLVALIIVLLVLPQFNALVNKDLSLTFSPGFSLMLLLTTLITGFAAGMYPAIYLSGIKITKALKKQLSWSGLTLIVRKGLVAFQFIISVTFIFLALVVYKQIEFVQSKDLGFDKENVVVIPVKGKIQEDRDVFIKELRRLPGVVTASSLNQPIYHNNHITTRINWPGKTEDDVVEFTNYFINYDLIETYQIDMKEGRTFSKDFGSDTEAVIFNKAAIDAMGLEDPVGKMVNIWGAERKIIGVTENFHNRSLFEEVKPMLMWLRARSTWNIVVRLEKGSERTAIEGMERLSETFNPDYPFEYQFTDTKYAEMYQAETRIGVLSRIFVLLACIIPGLGLYSLAAFSVEKRFKEIGIRRALGLPKVGVVVLLTKEFIKIVLLAVVISVPISFLIANDWLDSFAFNFELKWWYFLLTGLLAVLIALLTTLYQSVKGANINVIKSLKYE